MQMRPTLSIAVLLACFAGAGSAVEQNYGAVATLDALDAGIAQRRAAITANQNIDCGNVGPLLTRLFDIDQFARFSIFSICPSAEASCFRNAAERGVSVDADNLTLLKPIIARYSWRELKTCGGKDAQLHAWLLVQHADRDEPFQRAVLTKMRAAFLAGDVSGSEYAYLVDRVASGEKRLQLFGTQGTCDGDRWKPDPVLAPNGLDERRHEVGLGPEAAYAELAAGFCKPKPAKPRGRG